MQHIETETETVRGEIGTETDGQGRHSKEGCRGGRNGASEICHSDRNRKRKASAGHDIDGAGLMRKLYHVRVGAREIARERISWGKIDAGIDNESDQSFKIVTFRVNQMSQCFL